MRYDNHKKAWRERGIHQGEKYDLTAQTKTALREKIARRKFEIDEGKMRISRQMRVSEWSKEYLEGYRIEGVSSAHETNLRGYQAHVDGHFGKMMIKDVLPLDCRNFAQKLGKFSGSHAKKILSFARAMFDAAAENKLIYDNPMTKSIHVPDSCVDGERRALTEQEREQFMAYADIHEHGLWIKVQILCGLRSGETARIFGEHIDVENSRLWVDGTKSKKAKRWVPIPDVIMPDMAIRAKSPSSRVFTNAYGSKIDKSSRERMWRAFVRGLNIRLGAKVYRNELVGVMPVAGDLTPHCLRHTFASYAEECGIPLRVIADLMGHEEQKTTTGYTHTTDATFRNAADLLNGKKGSITIDDMEIGFDELTEVLAEIKRRKIEVLTPQKTPPSTPREGCGNVRQNATIKSRSQG